jgi:hypothetical protein
LTFNGLRYCGEIERVNILGAALLPIRRPAFDNRTERTGTSMANSNSTQVSGTKSVSYKTTDLAGLYAYRFNGFAISNNILHNLVGVGQFEIKRNGALSGHHKSSITAMQGSAKLHTGSYDLTGTISLPANGKGMGSASVKFKKKTGTGLDVDGKFHLQVAGPADRLWLISSGATLPQRPNKDGSPMQADELVTIEAIRIA